MYVNIAKFPMTKSDDRQNNIKEGDDIQPSGHINNSYVDIEAEVTQQVGNKSQPNSRVFQ